jgi:NAD(P)-dependent dehydrogenase (short-subunit alcohol dehydrogenase family)
VRKHSIFYQLSKKSGDGFPHSRRTFMQGLRNKVILVTGASDGIGKLTATTLAKQGHTITIHGRNRQKTEAALAEIKRESGNRNVEMLLGDFLSLAGVKAFAEAIKEKYDHLDVLIKLSHPG